MPAGFYPRAKFILARSIPDDHEHNFWDLWRLRLSRYGGRKPSAEELYLLGTLENTLAFMIKTHLMNPITMEAYKTNRGQYPRKEGNKYGRTPATPL